MLFIKFLSNLTGPIFACFRYVYMFARSPVLERDVLRNEMRGRIRIHQEWIAE